MVISLNATSGLGLVSANGVLGTATSGDAAVTENADEMDIQKIDNQTDDQSDFQSDSQYFLK